MAEMLSLAILLLALISSADGFWFWATKHCFDRIGCFSNRSPFYNALGEVPQSPAKIEPEFILYTRGNPDGEQVLNSLDTMSLQTSNFKPTRNTKLIIHGYIHNGRVKWVKDMTRAILLKDDVNVIVVNWERGAMKFNYAKAVANTRVIGALTAELIQTLNSVTGASFHSFHLIGHSLGAHVAGYAGQRTAKLGRITGLDPAGPLFLYTDPQVRLDPSDATFVDVIHTDGDIFGFGFFSSTGTADFYPNGGKHQPGCGFHSWGRAVNELSRLRTEEFKDEFSCDHMRVINLFTSSVDTPCLACACPEEDRFNFNPGCTENCTVMGYTLDNPEVRGIFYLTTQAGAPYCSEVNREDRITV